MEALVHADTYLKENGVELITRDGNLQVLDYEDVKALCFASEGAPATLFTEETTFERRPKTPGLWTSFRFRDGDILEGILSHDLLSWPTQGYLLTPPRSGTYRQRVFVPRLAVRETVLLGMVGKAPRPAPKQHDKLSLTDTARQLSMFD
jgi:hypothetical protein